MTITITESITCDSCKKELITHTSYPANYSLQLAAINTNRNDTGFTYGVGVVPPIEKPHHFCGFACLENWIAATGKK